jgi:hypothetical protein
MSLRSLFVGYLESLLVMASLSALFRLEALERAWVCDLITLITLYPPIVNKPLRKFKGFCKKPVA